MTRVRLLLLAALAWAGAAQAQDDWNGGFLMLAQERNTLRQSVPNVDQFGIPEHTSRLASLLEGRYSDITWRARLETVHTNLGSQNQGKLQELNRVFVLDDSVSLSLGKRLYALDPSYFNQPLGFLQKSTDLSDPLDTLGNAEGIPMAILSWSGAHASMAALYAKEHDGIAQSLLKYAYEFDAFSASVLLRDASGEGTGVGATLSGAAGDALSYYVSAYSVHGTQQRATVGAIYTPATWPKVQLEYAYDGRSTLPSGHPAPQRYVSLSLAQLLGSWDVNGGIYAGLDDRSRVWHALAEYSVSQRTKLMLSAVLHGDRWPDVRARAPVARSLAVRLRWMF
jgi:hypothetical protein